MDGERIADTDAEAAGDAPAASTLPPPFSLRERAECEARRLRMHREWIAASTGRHDAAPILVTALRTGRSNVPPGLICIYTLTLSTSRGNIVHTEIAVVHEPRGAGTCVRTPAETRHAVRTFLDLREPAVRAALLVSKAPSLADVAAAHRSALETRQARERALRGPASSAARDLVQAGLFDGRALREHAARQRAAATLIEASGERLDSLASAQTLTTAIDLSAILLAPGRT
jgi:hypothetical protein